MSVQSERTVKMETHLTGEYKLDKLDGLDKQCVSVLLSECGSYNKILVK